MTASAALDYSRCRSCERLTFVNRERLCGGCWADEHEDSSELLVRNTGTEPT